MPQTDRLRRWRDSGVGLGRSLCLQKLEPNISMPQSNKLHKYVLLSESELVTLSDNLYNELDNYLAHDKKGRTATIINTLKQTQETITKNINNLTDEQTQIVKELIAHDLL